MDGRVKGYSRPFARNSRSAELAAAVAAPQPVLSAKSAGLSEQKLGLGPSSTVTSASAGPSVKPTIYTSSKPSTSTSAAAAAAAAAAPPVVAQEYSVRVPKANLKPISIMRFNGALNVEPSKWTSLKMAREDNSKSHKPTFIQEDDNMPKFGAGSEYGREAREEARRRKYGGANRKKYNAEEQPWIMKTSEKGNRKYRGVKEGGVSENASYYIFTQAVDGAFEVFPVNHWYNFTPIQRYKSLTAEEAEEQFGRRNKIYNYFSVMVRKRLKAEDDEGEEGEKLPSGKPSKKGKASSGLKVSEMEDWEDSDNEESEDGSDKEGDSKDKKPKKKKAGKPKKKRKGSDEEADEDSDDGDEEGRELDYISDTSETESEDEKDKKNEIKGVDQEEGLKNLLDSDSDEEEEKAKEEDKDDEEKEEDGEKKTDANAKKTDETGKETKKKPAAKKKAKPKDKSDSSAQENLSDDEDESAIVDELDNAIETAKLESGSSGNNSGNSRDGTPDVDGVSGGKRKATSDLINSVTNAKKAKIELSPALVQSAASEGITEEAVRRYLLRKPITVTELLQKFKSKKTKIPSQDMVNVIAHLLKRINPIKKTQNHKMYLYLNKS